MQEVRRAGVKCSREMLDPRKWEKCPSEIMQSCAVEPCGGEGCLPLKRGGHSSGEGQKEEPGLAGCGVFAQS